MPQFSSFSFIKGCTRLAFLHVCHILTWRRRRCWSLTLKIIHRAQGCPCFNEKAMEQEERTDDGDAGLFVDLEFPADDSALFSDSSTPISKLKGSITWLRPQDICPSPALIPEEISLGHAKQGLLGDCWFLCACTHLLQNKHLLNKVIPQDQPLWGDRGYKGLFHFSFWQHGHWKDIIIDDLLPCKDFKLCFSRCLSPTAFWVALLEKAYAKLRGSYERLWAGQVSEALVDLTGGLAERWSLGALGSEEKKVQHDTALVQRRTSGCSLVKSVKDNCLLSCSTQSRTRADETTEAGQYHALNVLEWLEVSTMFGLKVHLLRIRNPWGRCCSAGSWGKGGEGWSTLDPLCAMDLQARILEGEFWLDEEEFVSMFDDVTAGYEINVNGHIKSIYSGNILIHSDQLAGEWIKGYSAGGSRNSNSYTINPKYWLKVSQRGEVLVSLLQHKEKKKMVKSTHKSLEKKTHHQRYQAIALHIWKVEKRRFNLSRVLNKAPITSTHCHAYDREVVLHEELEPGYYLVIPSTYQPEAEAHYLIRVFSSSSISLSALKSPAASLPITVGEWEDSHFQGAWVEGSTAGGGRNFPSHGRNPSFLFSVCDDPLQTPGVNIKISLHQSHPKKELHPIGFHIYEAKDDIFKSISTQDNEPVASCIPHCYNQVVALSCHLSPGVYTIVPSTFEPDCAGEFTLCISHRVHRKVVKCQETLGRTIQEVSCISLMRS